MPCRLWIFQYIPQCYSSIWTTCHICCNWTLQHLPLVGSQYSVCSTEGVHSNTYNFLLCVFCASFIFATSTNPSDASWCIFLVRLCHMLYIIPFVAKCLRTQISVVHWTGSKTTDKQLYSRLFADKEEGQTSQSEHRQVTSVEICL